MVGSLNSMHGRFEDAYQRQNGRLPKGKDRRPLASTYAQYREWKKNIRDHAAMQVTP